MLYFSLLVVFIFGLIIGSFINCLIYRLRHGQNFFTGRSHCPLCRHQIAWYDNIPLLSYLILRAKCRHCHKAISWQYPIVELITGLLFLIIFWQQMTIVDYNVLMLSCFNVLMILRNFVFTAFLIIIFLYDLKYYLILDSITIPAMIVALLFNLFIGVLTTPSSFISIFLNFFVSAFILGVFFLLQFLISRGKWLGGGDIRLGILMGLMLGWPNSLVALTLGYILGSLAGLGLIAAHKKTFQSRVPLGTFLTITTFIALLWGDKIINWYMNFTF